MNQCTFTVELGQWFQRLNWGRIIELFLTWLILLITLPAGIVFAIIIKLQDRGPIFYQGTRLGKDRKLFTIYKLRTLVIDAEQIIGSNLYDPSQKLTTPIGVFLRDTHFDELPQLWCVIKGDMALIGPRPERPAVYASMCKEIPHYDYRFCVAPGILGYSQLFTPHCTSKRIRSYIDNYYIKRRSVLSDFSFFFKASAILAQRLLRRTLSVIPLTVSRLMKGQRLRERRKQQRKRPLVSKVYIDDDHSNHGRILNVTSEALLVEFAHPINNTREPLKLKLVRRFIRKARRRRKTCHIATDIIDTRKGRDDTTVYLLEISEATALNHYLFNKYFRG